MKTIDELKEMVNSTITTNGTKQIAGADLRNALLEIIGTACAGGGATRTRLYLPATVLDETAAGLTEEQQAENAELYAAIKDAYDNGGAYPMVEMYVRCESIDVVYSMNGDVVCAVGDDGFVVLIMNQNLGEIMLFEDGSVGSASDTGSYSLSPARMSTLNLAHNG